ncbi:hypothetical protein Cgig2_034114 [Carnegiea gigantea]|uniref:Uncharacterized protein n=1 Tax=Carnegiea gigantea TaxID=171969 RepID=A0A9Q1K340_9CARY|nr:hypothetical protein Cgig2_034114 [Carnegiea gigantea]
MGDLRMFLKGNDEHGYDHGVVYEKSDRDRDNIVQEGRKGAGLKSSSPQPGNGLDIVRNYGICLGLYSYWVVSCDPTPPLSSMFTEQKTNVHHSKPYSVTSKPIGNLPCLPIRKLMFTVVSHAPQPVNTWITGRLQPWVFVMYSYWLLSCGHNLTPALNLMLKFCMFSAGRSPHSFIDERIDFNCGKPFSATDKPMGN